MVVPPRHSFSNGFGGGGGSFGDGKKYYVTQPVPDPVFLSWGALVAALLRR